MYEKYFFKIINIQICFKLAILYVLLMHFVINLFRICDATNVYFLIAL